MADGKTRVETDNTVQPNSSNGNVDSSRELTVLALDGGGIKGLASLLVVQILMELIKERDPNWPRSFRIDHKSGQRIVSNLPRPCDYFDLMWGTSAGGLTALMLGRLRMNVEDAVDTYKRIGEEVFRHRRVFFPFKTKYSSRQLKDLIIEDVIKTYCRDCGSCRGICDLQQLDAQKCRCALLTRRVGLSVDPGVHILRSYDNIRPSGVADDQKRHGNRHYGEASNLRTWEAALATSAAPWFFAPQLDPIYGFEYTDGALGGFNNPAEEAFHEARRLSPQENQVAVVMSVGTGAHSHYASSTSWFKRRLLKNLSSKLFRFLVRDSLDTEQVHYRMERTHARSGHLRNYYRFQFGGLEEMKMDEWKRSRKARQLENGVDIPATSAGTSGTAVPASNGQTPLNGVPTGTMQSHNITLDTIKPTYCLEADHVATQQRTETVLNPDFIYHTVEKMKTSVCQYLGERYITSGTPVSSSTPTVRDKLNELAELLAMQRQARYQNDPASYDRFIQDEPRAPQPAPQNSLPRTPQSELHPAIQLAPGPELAAVP